MIFRTAIFSFLALGLSAAKAQEINPADPQSVVSALQDLGYRAALTTDDIGDPLIESATAGVEYSIYFYGCVDNADCEDMHFLVGLDFEDGMDVDTIQSWNKTSLIGTAYLDDEQDPFLGFYLVTTGGVKRETFEEAIELWSQSVGFFLDHTGFNQ